MERTKDITYLVIFPFLKIFLTTYSITKRKVLIGFTTSGIAKKEESWETTWDLARQFK